MGIDKTDLYQRADAVGIPRELIDQVTASEGLRLAAYRCPTGHVTVGWGHNLEARPVPGVPVEVGAAITRQQADRLLICDLLDARREMLRRWPWAEALSAPRQGVLWDMIYNVGGAKVAEFRRALAAMQAGDYRRAAAEMLDSDWHAQVGGRAEGLARQMVSGAWR